MSAKPFPTIVLVEDDPQAVYLLQRYVDCTGGRLFSTRLFEKALTLARQENPDVIFIDLILPGTSGWDVLQGLRASADAQLRDIPVVICSCLPARSRSQAVGVEFLQKPILYEDFLAILSKLGLNPLDQEKSPVYLQTD